MKKNLIKMRVCLGFDCVPRLDIISYEDELSPSGKPYQSTKGVRNDKTEVDFGQSWMRFDNAAKTPYWDAYVILDASKETEATIAEKASELHVDAINAMDKGLKEAQERFVKLLAPPVSSLEQEVHAKLHPTIANSAKIVVSVEKFKELIGKSVKESGRKLAEQSEFGAEKWDGFYEQTLTPDILSILMKGLPVLKFVGDGIEFQTQEMYEQAVMAVSGKVTSDVFARFVETMRGGATSR